MLFSEQYIIFLGTTFENIPQIIDTKIVVFFEILKLSSECRIFQNTFL